ncbi:Periplasmic protein TonB links inner and outer membranes-like protein [Dehalobacter sp. UNSWDHB]|uniref:hypothetical protein n=1 Tax=Dehalobacter sp. UNSWDHB TaxID=1339256 RepID=UPI0003877249|nr:hypothetical protein [Dehalobacter sp. UNSWDHB]EQB20442.1 Periplasmic protein TonB links inner and outer membranes-like protein [Dehalobacter sp. UNSWDHB]
MIKIRVKTFSILLLVLSVVLFGCSPKKTEPVQNIPAQQETQIQKDNQSPEKELEPIKETEPEQAPQQEDKTKTETETETKAPPSVEPQTQPKTEPNQPSEPDPVAPSKPEPAPEQKPPANSGLSLYSLGQQVDVQNNAAKTDKEKAAYEAAARWLVEFKSTDYKKLEAMSQMPGSSYTTASFQNSLDNFFPNFKSESIKNKDTRQVKSLCLDDISFNQIPQLNNQEGAFLKLTIVINAAQNGGNYWVSEYEERIILLQVNGVWMVDSEENTQLKM